MGRWKRKGSRCKQEHATGGIEIRMTREFEKGLNITNLRPFLKMVIVQVKLEDIIRVKRSIHRPDFLATQFVLGPGHIVTENQVLGLEVSKSQSLQALK